VRRLALAAAFALLGAIGAVVPAAPVLAAQTSNAKVVIIVGATEGATATYRSYADQAYAEAIKYTPRVTKVYSPNATWAKVQAATAGANLVLYYGHGNGWPSPYPYDPAYTTKDGFGLNDPSNLSDNVHKYYGEPYVAQLGLAPNAIVLLGNLCYASGNSEPGGVAPSVSVAHQRIDNYAAGFLKGNAEAVIADGHGGLLSYIDALFTTNQSIVNLWKSVPDFHNHVASFASARTPGYTAYSDPDTTSGGYYRSLVTKPTLTSGAVVTAGDTGTDPTTLVVPGRAEIETAATPLYATSTSDLASDVTLDLPAGTRLKVIAVGAAATATSPAMIQVQGLDDPSIAGYVAANELTPKDSRAPIVVGVDTGIGRLSPNGDGIADTDTIDVLFSESVAWTLTIKNGGGTVVDTASGSGSEATPAWDGLVGGTPVADGSYTWSLAGTDAWENGTATASGTLVVDTAAPTLTVSSPADGTTPIFSPNGDGVGDVATVSATSSEAGTLTTRIMTAAGAYVRTLVTPATAGTTTFTWDGLAGTGALVADGDYRLSIVARDAAGNAGAPVVRTLRVVTIVGFVATSTPLFYPQDLDRFAPTATLSFKAARPATVTWVLKNAAGAVVLTHLDHAAVPAGTVSWAFDGRGPDGTMLPVGVYAASVTATDGVVSTIQSVRVEMNAFSISTSASTARRGSSITITAQSAEPLTGNVQLRITQPGLADAYVTMTKLATNVYRSTVTLRTGGSAGTAIFRVSALDADGRWQASSRALPLS
jgi:flagellar hook assembly protein FlgD